MGSAGFLLRVTKPNSSWMGFLSGDCREESASRLIQLIGIFQFLVVVGLTSIFLLVVNSRLCSEISQCSPVLEHGFFIFKASSGASESSCASNLSEFSSASSQRKFSASKEFLEYLD